MDEDEIPWQPDSKTLSSPGLILQSTIDLMDNMMSTVYAHAHTSVRLGTCWSEVDRGWSFLIKYLIRIAMNR